MIEMQGYLSFLAGNDLFGTLALFNILVVLFGLSKTMRASKYFKLALIIALLLMPALYFMGLYFLNLSPA